MKAAFIMLLLQVLLGSSTIQARLIIETLEFSTPGQPAHITRAVQLFADGDVLQVSSERFKVQHSFTLRVHSAHSIELLPRDPAAAGTLLYAGRDGDEKQPRSYAQETATTWRRNLAEGDMILLQEPGISDAGVQWKITL